MVCRVYGPGPSSKVSATSGLVPALHRTGSPRWANFNRVGRPWTVEAGDRWADRLPGGASWRAAGFSVAASAGRAVPARAQGVSPSRHTRAKAVRMTSVSRTVPKRGPGRGPAPGAKDAGDGMGPPCSTLLGRDGPVTVGADPQMADVTGRMGAVQAPDGWGRGEAWR
jgi:hypothetical protein